MKKKILILSITPFNNTRSRIIKEFQSLSGDFEPLVVALNNGQQPDEETMQSVSVRRISLKTKSLPKKFIFQLPKFYEFGKKVFDAYKNYDIVDCHSLIALVIGYYYKKKYNAKLVYNAHELETERVGLSGLKKKILKIIEKKIIYDCDAVIVVSDSIREWYMNTYRINNVFCIYNSPRYIDIQKSDYFREKYKLEKTDRIFLYQGNFQKGRGIELLCEAFAKMQGTNNYIVFMGKGPYEKKIGEYAANNSNIFVHDSVPYNELGFYTSSADFGIAINEKISMNSDYSMSNKLFESVMYGIPVIVSNTKDKVNFVCKNNVGYVLPQYTTESLVELIQSIDYSKYDELKENVNRIRHDVSWDNQEQIFIGIYQDIVKNSV